MGVEAVPSLLKERYAMNEDRIVALRQPDEIDDPLTESTRPVTTAFRGEGVIE